MKWSFRIGKFLDIPVYVHATFPLLLAWIGLGEWLRARSLAQSLTSVLFILLIFGCVVLHEFGHALAARRYGIRTRDVTLLPIGGIARLERMPERPAQELWVALAGPAVNVGIAALLGGWLALGGTLQSVLGSVEADLAGGALAGRLLVVNVVLVLFNLLPAFPMDGGRVLRALLATRLSYPRATDVAARVGRGFAVLFGVAGLFGSPLLLLVAVFVWFGAGREADMVRVRSSFSDTPVGSAMLTDFHTLAPGDRLRRAVDLTLAGSQKDFPVVEEGRMVGLLRHDDLLAGLNRSGPEAAVGEAMRRDYQPVDWSELIDAVFTRLQAGAVRTLPVIRHGHLVGLVTLENIAEYLAIKNALGYSIARATLHRVRG